MSDIVDRLDLEHLQICGLMNPEQCHDVRGTGMPCACSVIEDAKSEILTLREELSIANEWQPLEAAPTDRFILGWIVEAEGCGVLDLIRYEPAKDGYCWKGCWWGDDPYHESCLRGWMYLPEPPEGEE